MNIVSNSEMEILDKCERMFYYAVGLGIQPKALPKPLAIGIFGHRLQEAFWKAILRGESKEIAFKEMGALVLESLEDPEVASILRQALAFCDWALEQGWFPLEVETVRVTRMDNDIQFGMKPDAVFKFTKGVNKGRQFVVDFKHTAQPWNDQQINTYIQVPKYIRFLNEHYGYHITKGAVVMLHTRASKSHDNNLFSVKWIPLNKTKLERIAVENYKKAKKVAHLKSLPIVELEDTVSRTVNNFQCKMCAFTDLCNLDFLGHDSSKTMATLYEQNEYGYNEYIEDSAS